ncbi:hypothetical protein CDAR_530181 [Caerostris darwini]|uniref:Uncharacterized protein n=1 Tax=Caerostris darwini TaxID=1538125 RepID=A0AAV4S2P2_9ARAC|nr:hypothetical protein CDAR_530181 [Caerostris darwini]
MGTILKIRRQKRPSTTLLMPAVLNISPVKEYLCLRNQDASSHTSCNLSPYDNLMQMEEKPVTCKSVKSTITQLVSRLTRPKTEDIMTTVPNGVLLLFMLPVPNGLVLLFMFSVPNGMPVLFMFSVSNRMCPFVTK